MAANTAATTSISTVLIASARPRFSSPGCAIIR